MKNLQPDQVQCVVRRMDILHRTKAHLLVLIPNLAQEKRCSWITLKLNSCSLLHEPLLVGMTLLEKTEIKQGSMEEWVEY